MPDGEVIVERGSTAQVLGPKLNRISGDVIRFLLLQGEMVTATQSLSDEMIELFADEIGATVKLVDPGEEQEALLAAKYFESDEEEEQGQAEYRPPVVTVMGHVDHGKTTLLDTIRNANVASGEAGGITQHIGAYMVGHAGKSITFIDTPGHEAFTAMRARGAQVTDLVVLVVAANDGVMPQTVEAISHARASEVPIIVAITKVDRPDSDPNRVMQQLSEHGLVPESWGGDTVTIEVSPPAGVGVDDLLEHIVLLAELQELTAVKEGSARGAVLEANLDVGRGPVATVLVQRGHLKLGDVVVAGPAWGKVKALIDDSGLPTKGAGPSTPVVLLGLSTVPSAGDEFRVVSDQSTARTIAEAREQRIRALGHAPIPSAARAAKLEDLFEQVSRGELATLNLILKADVQGSLEALTDSLRKLEREEVRISFVHRAVGAITENDVSLAAASGATIIGFNVRPDRRAREAAESQGVEIRTYEVVYKILEDIEAALVGMLKPEFEEVVTGEAEVREVFRVPKIGPVAGCYVRSGTITRGSKVRFLREGVIIWKGTISSLRRFKDDVRDVSSGFECGIGLSDFQDLKDGDIIETFEDREITRT
ncbi:MAG TPA: translation initiation factor IF-2 [Acidimicrobiales bacterium]|nr:translation initiation factor IF-2 [Acidimicrobiales bacterium]